MTFDFNNARPDALKAEYSRIAKKMGDDQFFTKKELAHLPSVLAPGEQVLAFSSGLMDANTWLICLTDRRVIFLDKGIIYGLKQVSIDLDRINAVTGETGLLMGKIKIQDGAAEREIKNVWKKTVVPFTNELRDAMRAAKMVRAQPVPPAASNDDVIAKLERLAGLKERGVLSDAEFAEQKARILAA